MPATAKTHLPQVPAAPEAELTAPRVPSSQALLNFIPTTLQIAAGADFVALSDEATPGGALLLQQFSPVTIMLAQAGIQPDQIEQLWTGCDRTTGDSVTCVRTRTEFNPALVLQRLDIKEPAKKIGNVRVHTWTAAESQCAVAFPNAKTLVIGRDTTVKAALMNPAPGPIRHALDALAQPQAHYWAACDDPTSRRANFWKLESGASDSDRLDRMYRCLHDTPPMRGFAMSVARWPSVKEQPQTGGAFRNFGGTHSLLPENDPAVPVATTESVELSIAASCGSEAAATLTEAVLRTALPVNSAKTVLARAGENVSLKHKLELTDPMRLGGFFAAASGASGNSAIDGGLLDGSLPRVSRALGQWVADHPDRFIHVNALTRRPNDSLGWMIGLLPYIDRADLYRKIDLTRGWADRFNRHAACTVIPAFLNPADPRATWNGAPHPGVALTHFAGMAGVEDSRDVVAGDLPRSDPRAGTFGYDRVAGPNEITDGLAQTIMVIGTGELVAPWAQGGGATIRGARQPYFDKLSGFGSRGLRRVGTYVLFADGSARVMSASIDPAVFRAMCTMHGNDLINLGPAAAGK